jgi:hypothetical protein
MSSRELQRNGLSILLQRLKHMHLLAEGICHRPAAERLLPSFSDPDRCRDCADAGQIATLLARMEEEVAADLDKLTHEKEARQ